MFNILHDTHPLACSTEPTTTTTEPTTTTTEPTTTTSPNSGPFRDCETLILHCGGAAEQSCEISVTTTRTDTRDWSMCQGASAGAAASVEGGVVSAEVSAEVSMEVCGSSSGTAEDSQTETNTITTEKDQPVVACQQGKTINVNGETFTKLYGGYRTHAGSDCSLPACPAVQSGQQGAGAGSEDPPMETSHSASHAAISGHCSIWAIACLTLAAMLTSA